ncbi:MAG: LacI family DNA-binding transcriptional regulator [Sphaerochaeta sp.]|jgi:LacI family transcriptional regulator|nr:LacI family DNA-binding transcriptional regulator [Sphaerochaeta sp.]PKL26891.1 MAG: transcriptional regulator [Spirochaetae bacterium HGW-Spirochaetae-2]
MVTLKDIAQKVDRSVTTVSRALAGCPDVSKETIRIVREAAQEMGYVPNSMAQRLQKQSSDTIGVVAPVSSKGYAEPFFCEFLAGIGEQAAQFGYDLLVAYAQEHNEMGIYRKLVSGRKVDGFILSRTLVDDPRAHYLHSIGFPFAAFGRIDGMQDYPYVEEDGEYAMELVAEHLVSRGHTRIACICPPQSVLYSKVRLEGLRRGLESRGIRLDPEMIGMGAFDQEDGYAHACTLLEHPHPPTAIVGFNDLIAFGAINAGKDRGLRIGSELAVTGFDDIPMAAMYRPPLTTVRQPIKEIGQMVTSSLIDTIQEKYSKTGRDGLVAESHQDTVSHRQLLLRPNLVVRNST